MHIYFVFQWAGSSVYYLLNLWSRSVTSVRYLKSDKPNLLDEYVPKVIEGFVSSRFDSLQSELSDELGENPLDNVEVLQDQLEFFPFLCRFQYESCSSYLMKIVEPIMKSYMNEIHVDSYELSVTESKLAWFTHIVAAILRTKQISGSSGESHEILDAEISACVLQLINICDSGFHSKVCPYVPIWE
ncbi:Ran-binding protein 17 [Glycine soja]|uniref:Ran-binding protein 17 n=1 Tax=Glycine soja TaxID=3848 RepID=A0A0B2Q5F8_GLYSO|nr:Ran-binding protein 17 [Glycine soja]